MEIKKLQSGAIIQHIRHDIREHPEGQANFGNESIIPELTKYNESLISRGKTAEEINTYRKNLEKEIFKYNRKNLIHAVEVVIQLPDDCPVEQESLFFRECLDYIASTLPRGEKDIFVAEIHRDERHYSPSGELLSKNHLHVMYVPAVKDNKHEGFDYKLCADSLTRKAQLKQWHPQLQKRLHDAGIQATVVNKKKTDGKIIPLNAKQLKLYTEITGQKLDHPLTVDEIKQVYIQNAELVKELEKIDSIKVTVSNLKKQLSLKDSTIEQLQSEVAEKRNVESQLHLAKSIIQAQRSRLQEVELSGTKIDKLSEINEYLSEQLQQAKEIIQSQQVEIENNQSQIKKLEAAKEQELHQNETEISWSNDDSWGSGSSWGNTPRNRDIIV